MFLHKSILRRRNGKNDGGKNSNAMKEKVSAAVEATAGDIIVYGDEMISAMFFSTSNGQD